MSATFTPPRDARLEQRDRAMRTTLEQILERDWRELADADWDAGAAPLDALDSRGAGESRRSRRRSTFSRRLLGAVCVFVRHRAESAHRQPNRQRPAARRAPRARPAADRAPSRVRPRRRHRGADLRRRSAGVLSGRSRGVHAGQVDLARAHRSARCQRGGARARCRLFRALRQGDRRAAVATGSGDGRRRSVGRAPRPLVRNHAQRVHGPVGAKCSPNGKRARTAHRVRRARPPYPRRVDRRAAHHRGRLVSRLSWQRSQRHRFRSAVLGRVVFQPRTRDQSARHSRPRSAVERAVGRAARPASRCGACRPMRSTPESRRCPRRNDSRSCPLARRSRSPASSTSAAGTIRSCATARKTRAHSRSGMRMRRSRWRRNSAAPRDMERAVYTANMTLSALALRDGDTRTAVARLAAASRAPATEELVVRRRCGVAMARAAGQPDRRRRTAGGDRLPRSDGAHQPRRSHRPSRRRRRSRSRRRADLAASAQLV